MNKPDILPYLLLDTKTNRVRMTVSRGNIIYDSEKPDL